ncbi:MAG TPA: c-type cytochrome [Candidatus Acidoferrum sp.]|nr:c-type cytochrome [Candidatus Acidoferrum sp.]
MAALLAWSQVPLGDEKPYQVVDGDKVDKSTLEGWHTWRALACDRCHGDHQQGLVGPSLLESMTRLSKNEFEQTVLDGRPEKGMPSWRASKMLNEHIDGLYAYLKGRSDGAIKAGHLYEMK